MNKQFLCVILFLFLCLFLYGQTGDVHDDEGDYIVKNGDHINILAHDAKE